MFSVCVAELRSGPQVVSALGALESVLRLFLYLSCAVGVGRRGAGISLSTSCPPVLGVLACARPVPTSGAHGADESCTLFSEGQEGVLTTEVTKRMPNGARGGEGPGQLGCRMTNGAFLLLGEAFPGLSV